MPFNDVSKILASKQTGQYIPTDEEKSIQQAIASSPVGSIDMTNFRLAHPIFMPGNEQTAQEAIEAGFGTQPRYDVGTFDPEKDLEHQRAIEQSSGRKILNGAIKGGITAGTTAVNTVAGVIDGLLEGGYEFARQAHDDRYIDMGEVIGKGTNNFITRMMNNIQRLSEEWFPNYRTEEERSDKYQDEWYKHIFTANFIGDSFLKNFGFTAGSIIGGGVWSKALAYGLRGLAAGNLMRGIVAAAEGDAEATSQLTGFLKAVGSNGAETIGAKSMAKVMADAAKPLHKMSTMHQLFGGVIAALGEGTFEGVNARQEFMDGALGGLQKEYGDELRDLQQNFMDRVPDSMVLKIANPDGTITRQLTEEGEALYNKRLSEIRQKYSDAFQYVNEIGDKVAGTTLLWNLPILTVSNTLVYGRMLSGGWKTARNTAKVAGAITKAEGKLASNLSGTGSKAALSALGALKNGGTEAAEEMLQGFVSSGAKRVADDRLSSFNDSGYDRESMEELGNWFGSFAEGGMDYLKDGRNWQEGFLGMMTGLVGIPGRGYFRGERGGIFGAIAEANEKTNASSQAANTLNNLVNSEEFQNRWKGWVRHQKAENEMSEAVQNDDQYAWKSKNDWQLVNDVITFANAGRLQDLNEIVDYYAGMSEADTDGLEVLDASTSPENEKQVQNNPSKVVANVKEQASEIKEMIQLYNDMYDSMSTLAPAEASREQIEEMIATAMNVKAFEKRFLSMYNEVLDGIKNYVGPITTRDDKGRFEKHEDALRKAEEIYTALNKLFTSFIIPSEADVIDDMDTLPTLKKLKSVIDKSDNQELKKKIDDMAKLAKDRRAFINKLTTLKNLDPFQWTEEAKSGDKVAKEIAKERADEEVSGMNTLSDVKARYAAEDKRTLGNPSELIETLRKASDSNENVAKFLKLYDAYTELRQTFVKQSGSLSGLSSEMMSRALNEANNANEVFDSSRVETYEQYQKRLSDTIGRLTAIDDILPLNEKMNISRETYDAARQKVVSAMDTLRSVKQVTEGRTSSPKKQPVASAQPESKKLEVSTDPVGPVSPAPDPNEKKSATLSDDGQSATDAAGRIWKIGDTVHCYDETKANPTPETGTVTEFEKKGDRDVKMTVQLTDRTMKVSMLNQIPFIHKELPSAEVEAIKASAEDYPVQSPTPAQLVEDQAAPEDSSEQLLDKVGENNYGEKPYYQTGIPEYEFDDMVEYRDIKRNSDGEVRANKLKAFFQKLVSFIDHVDKKGKSNREKFGNLWDKLVSLNAFTNAVLHVRVGDKVKFIAKPGNDNQFAGRPYIYMAVEKNGQRYIFNVMRRSGSYEGLKDFIDAFDAEYKDWIDHNPNTEFVFSKESTVWAKRKGIIEYSYEENYAGEKSVKEIEGYDPNAPIVWITGSGEFQTLRGDVNAMRRVFTWQSMTIDERLERRGQLFYLADDGDGGYIPIRLGIEHFTPDNFDNDNATFNSIRTSLENIQTIAKRFFQRIGEVDESGAEAIRAEENTALHNEVANLKKYLNLTHGFFNFQFSKEGKPLLMYDRNTGAPGVRSEVSESFDGFFLDSTNIDTLVSKFAQEKIALDLNPTKNLSSMIDRGFITSNATKLLPKSVDTYIAPWEHGEFKLKDWQKDIVDTRTENVSPAAVETVEEKEMTFNDINDILNGFEDERPDIEVIPDFDESEIGGEEKPEEKFVAQEPWDVLTKDEQNKLIEHYGESIQKSFNDPSIAPETKNEWLECVGVK